jgi:hypothetical protein
MSFRIVVASAIIDPIVPAFAAEMTGAKISPAERLQRARQKLGRTEKVLEPRRCRQFDPEPTLSA